LLRDRFAGACFGEQSRQLEKNIMKTLVIELPETMAKALDRAVLEGGFRDEQELAREALRNYLMHSRFSLLEQHQLEDIRAALIEGGEGQKTGFIDYLRSIPQEGKTGIDRTRDLPCVVEL
jgi:Arc/MetJ-type ribon-helix-helix transcriptional regulator